MAKKHNCGGETRPGPKTVPVRPHVRSKPGPSCYGPGKPGPKTVSVKRHRRSTP